MKIDYLVVGSGLTGATIARKLMDAGRDVMVVDRRPHLGGNVHDHQHASGIRIHTYGPHYFRTSSERLWEWVGQFAPFYKYEAVVRSLVDGEYENWPIASSYIRRKLGNRWSPEFTGVASNFEEACLGMMPRLIYEKFVKGYTEKQWGVPCNQLSSELARRFEVRGDDEPRLVRHKYQGIPTNGYASLMQNMLAGIPMLLNFDYLKSKEEIRPVKKLVFTGPIDEFFGYDWGSLKYRGQKRLTEFFHDSDFAMPCGQVNNPDPKSGSHIRTLEWKHMLDPQSKLKIRGTVLTRETTYSPTNPEDYEYPFPDRANALLFQRYSKRAQANPNLLICGRLGEYRYYDMDQAIARAMVLADHLLTERQGRHDSKRPVVLAQPSK
jgi:UDP-galactopyranose mutase